MKFRALKLRAAFISSVSLIVLPFCSLVFAETAVIVNPANGNTVDKGLVEKIYLGKAKKFPDGTAAVPVDQKEGSALRSGFLDAMVGKNESQMKAYWSRLIFTGGGIPPQVMDSDQAVKDFVAKEVGGIGFIDASAVDSSVKVVTSF